MAAVIAAPPQAQGSGAAIEVLTIRPIENAGNLRALASCSDRLSKDPRLARDPTTGPARLGQRSGEAGPQRALAQPDRGHQPGDP